MKRKSFLLLFSICFLLGAALSAQQVEKEALPRHLGEIGTPFIQNYSADEYGAETQNWAIVQDENGLIYVGNNSGILTYDGVSWRLIQLPNKGVVRSLAIGNDNKIYVGGYNEFGYLAADDVGRLKYVSLKDSLPPDILPFDDVWQIVCMDDKVYFRSYKKLICLKDNEFKVWKGETYISTIKAVNNELLVAERGPVIKKIVNGQLIELVDLSDHEAEWVMRFLPYDKDELLVLTRFQGLFLLKENQITPFETEANQYLKENLGVISIKLSNGWYSIGTNTGGIVVLDSLGHTLKVLGKTEGLIDNTVLAQFEDRQKGIWLATNNGISRAELISPYSIFDDKSGAGGYINMIHRHNGKLYMANTYGISSLKKSDNNANSFESFHGNMLQGLYFISVGDTLFVAARQFLDIIVNNKSVEQLDYRSGSLLRSKIDPNRIYVGLQDGLASLEYKEGKWEDDGRINGVNDDIREIVEDSSGNLWLESQVDGVWKVDMADATKEGHFREPKVKHFRSNNELPEGMLFLHSIKNRPLFTINDDVFRYIGDLDSILPYPQFADQFGYEGKVSPKLEDADGNIWLTAHLADEERKKRLLAIKQNVNSYKIEEIHDERISDDLGKALFLDNNGIVWYGGGGGIVRHDLTMPPNFDKDFNTLIREITINKDSLIFGGEGLEGYDRSIQYTENTLRFEFAATSFDNEVKNQYQSYLDGFDENWSPWNRETQRDYTNIPEGTYTFKVRAKNIYAQIGKEDSYSFTILPPWYRTWWAYLSYTLGAILLLLLFGQWRSGQLRKKNIALEALVDERTEEIRHKNKLLGHQTERLKEMDTMKTRLFANISHEFRTPLTLIKGPIEKLEDSEENTISTTNVKMIRRNANRLLNLVNQLLDLSKLDSGKLKLNQAEGDVFKCIRASASAFSSHAASRQMDYQIKIPASLLWASFDRDKLEKIVYNLLSNALKFTLDEGRVIIEADFRSERLRLKVSDTGSGIAKDKLPHIFDRFFQVDDSYTREKSGSGIGLALTKELVELMGGTVYVESDAGKGTSFRIVLPLQEIKSSQTDVAREEIPTAVHIDDIGELPEQEKLKSGLQVLIIEDNNDMRHFIKEQLEQDYNIIEARNGREGLKIAEKIMPDLIVTDLMMPQMDGITLCKKLKTELKTSHIPVIMLTAKAGIENKLEGLETGADEYLTKPFNARELQIRTKNLIESRQQLRELFSKNISLNPKAITVTSLDEKFLEKVLGLLEEHHSDSQFGVPQMQKELGMSKTTLHSKIKALTNHPPGELLRNFRLKRATQLLKQKGDNISQVAYDVGFNSLSYFTRCFKEYYKMSPSEFLKKDI